MSNNYNFLYKRPSKDGGATITSAQTQYHHNQNVIEASAKIFKKFLKHGEVVAISEMQAGKTEIMKRLIYTIWNHNAQLRDAGIEVYKYNVHVVLCASSIDLKNQLREKLPEIKNKIYHLDDINRFLRDPREYESDLIPMADSSLLIFDECHCDAEINKIIDSFRKLIDKLAKQQGTSHLKLSCSATPYEQIISGYERVILKPDNNYYGIRDMFKTLRNGSIPLIFQAKKLELESECEKLFEEIAICNFYYIIRLPSNQSAQNLTIANIEKQFEKHFKKHRIPFDTHIYDMYYKVNINLILSVKPTKPTIFFLKDKLRMGEYLNTEYVYLVHDTPNSTYAHTAAQSLVGRCCGYNKASHRTIIYCDFEKITEHYEWVKHNYSTKYIPSNAKYINKRTGETKDNCIYQ